MADSNLFKPKVASSGLGRKKMDDGKFANPPAYPETSGFDGAADIRPQSATAGVVQKSPGAKSGRV